MSEERIRKNGVTMPQLGSKTRRPWDIATKLSEDFNRPATRDEVMKACEAEEISKGTRETQYSHWKRFHGLTGRVVKPGADPTPVPPKSPAKPAAKAAKPNKPANVVDIKDAVEAPAYDPKEGGVVNNGNTDVYDAGWDAYCEGKQENDNPHDIDSPEASDWTQGFREAAQA